ncbi:anthranilate synthase component II [Natronosalvus halobius]|uniref:anthranilate synthase component II n=1 Tax=Natronosalvus halobius TaxID=2953746 RepID=UPI0020A1D56E|nr:anthranilate synthase component II [Natronosalvus halobius]USZ72503.1 aminodeoxychorismate/anthranilate synthase component II [Natronosalvus halobius]
MSSLREDRVAGAPAETETEPPRPHVLVVDNFDSFTYNLVEYVSEHAETTVVKNTASLEDVRAVDADAIIISPGPGHPENDRDVGVSMDVIQELCSTVPILGVCLGLEAGVYAFGGRVERAPEPIHGKASPVSHDGQGVFSGLEQGFQAGRYHSLVAVDVPDCLEVTATTDHVGESLVMGVRHVDPDVALECVQFHPESVLTAVGHDVIENFLDGVRSQNGRTPR